MTFIVLTAIAKFGIEVLGWHSWNCVVWRERERERERRRERRGIMGKCNTTCVGSLLSVL